MMTNSLLLSDEAEADQKPELEIFADDVQCGHGATSGALDENLKFYLMARGIPEVEAEALLVQAFVGEAVEGIEHAGLRDALMEDVVAWLRARGELMHPAVTNGTYDVSRIRQDFPILAMQVYGKPLVYLDNAASAQKPQGGARPHPAGLHVRIRQRASRAALSRQRRDRGLRGRAREGAGVPQCAAAGRDHLHPQRHRGDQPRRLYVRPRAHQGRRRDRALDHGAPFQHRAVAFPARAPGRGDQMGAGRRGGQLPDRRVREAADAAHQDGGDHPHVEHARHAWCRSKRW